MPTSTGQNAARRAVIAAQAREGWNNAQLAKASSTDPATIRDFIDGSRWPKPPTLARIDAAMGWTPGTLAAIGEELLDEPQQNVSDGTDDEEELLFRRPLGLSDREWSDMRQRMRGGWEWELRQASRER